MSDTSHDQIGIVGAGFMGSGIAESVAKSGMPVVLHEPDRSALERSRGAIAESLHRAVRADKLAQADVGPVLSRVTWTQDIEALGECGLVVEGRL